MKIVVLDANFIWTQRLFSACGKSTQVLLLKPREIRSFYREHGRFLSDAKPREREENVWDWRICCPPGWLFGLWPVTERLLGRRIQSFTGGEKCLLVACYPYYASLAARLRAPLIYYSMDDYADYWPKRSQETERLERAAVNRAHATICVSAYRQRLLQSRSANPDRIHHLPHGCSPEFMARAPLSKPLDFPSAFSSRAGLRRPVAGYVGALNARFDFAYLHTVAVNLPEISFVLGGDLPASTDGSDEWRQAFQRCRSLPNLHFIGRIDRADLGRTLQSFDVLLMIYAQTDFNTSCSPTKLWDYLGTSLPIVANNAVPELQIYHETIYLSQTPEEFSQNILAALESNNRGAERRLALAWDHTWDRQAERLQSILSSVRNASVTAT
jgi:glycosyltransferase involved in cell wall biosynthesis